MTNEDFATWFKQLMARFPSVDVWYSKLPHESKAMQTEAWRDALRNEKTPDALEALKQIHAGSIEGWPEFNREQLGAHVARAARAIRGERENRATSSLAQAGSRAARRVKVNLIGWFDRLATLFTQGTPPDEAKRVARQEFLPQGVSEGPRYGCKDCLDSGTVCCWHPDTITRVIRGDNPGAKYSCEAPCHCDCGDRFIDKGMKRERLFSCDAKRYSPETHCPVTNSSLPPSEVEVILQWADTVRDRVVPGEWKY